jgi:hypothetical protein
MNKTEYLENRIENLEERVSLLIKEIEYKSKGFGHRYYDWTDFMLDVLKTACVIIIFFIIFTAVFR